MAFSELYYKYGELLANKKANYKGNILHYNSSYGLKGIIEEQNIWFSDRRFLNDPTECNYLYRLIAQNKCLFENSLMACVETIRGKEKIEIVKRILKENGSRDYLLFLMGIKSRYY